MSRPRNTIGSFGTRHEDVDQDFDYFGEVIRVNPKMTDLIPLDLAVKAGDMDENDPRAMGMVTDFVKALIHPDDWDLFWGNVMAYGQTQADLMLVISGIMEASTGRPTLRLSDSSDGPPATGTSSTDDASSLVVQRRLETQGRPDLALVVVQAREARAS